MVRREDTLLGFPWFRRAARGRGLWAEGVEWRAASVSSSSFLTAVLAFQDHAISSCIRHEASDRDTCRTRGREDKDGECLKIDSFGLGAVSSFDHLSFSRTRLSGPREFSEEFSV